VLESRDDGRGDFSVAISREVVARLSEMTRLGLTEAEIDDLAGEVSGILAHVDRIQRLDTSTVSGSVADRPRGCATREDRVSNGLRGEDVLANAPESHDGFFVVPAVFGE